MIWFCVCIRDVMKCRIVPVHSVSIAIGAKVASAEWWYIR
jgi:hypothetical protein